MPIHTDTTEQKPVTFRDKLQDLIVDIWKAYDTCSPLRDFACGNEKEAFNKARGSLYDAANALGALDNSLSRERADTPF